MKSEKGQSLVEFALVIPVLLLLLFAITDFGRAFHVYLTLDHAGREGARLASIGKADDVIINRILDSTDTISGFNATDNIKITPSSATRKSGSYVEITLTYDVELITPFVSSLVSKVPLKDLTKMRIE